MKIEKLSLKGIKNVLSRAELKKIMAGSGGCSACNVQQGGQCCECVQGEFTFGYHTICPPTNCNSFCEALNGAWVGELVNCSLCG